MKLPTTTKYEDRVQTLQEIKKAKPFLFTGIALAIYLCKPDVTIGDCYISAKVFVTRLMTELTAEDL
jgi:hypothetical protein